MPKQPTILLWAGLLTLLGFAAVALLAPVLSPYDPMRPAGPPLALPTAAHLLGTNDLGQDVLSQLIYGARTTLLVASGVTLLSTLLSWTVGLAAGFNRAAEELLMPLTELLLALPSLPLYMLVMTLVGPSLRNLVLTLALLSWPAFARIVRSAVIDVRAAPYVEAARASGASQLHIMRYHLLPATLDVLPSKLVLTVRYAVFTEATLSFLGLGDSASVSWGTMLSGAFADPLLLSRPLWPWLVLPPATAIAALVMASTLIGLGLSAGRSPGGSFA